MFIFILYKQFKKWRGKMRVGVITKNQLEKLKKLNLSEKAINRIHSILDTDEVLHTYKGTIFYDVYTIFMGLILIIALLNKSVSLENIGAFMFVFFPILVFILVIKKIIRDFYSEGNIVLNKDNIAFVFNNVFMIKRVSNSFVVKAKKRFIAAVLLISLICTIAAGSWWSLSFFIILSILSLIFLVGAFEHVKNEMIKELNKEGEKSTWFSKEGILPSFNFYLLQTSNLYLIPFSSISSVYDFRWKSSGTQLKNTSQLKSQSIFVRYIFSKLGCSNTWL